MSTLEHHLGPKAADNAKAARAMQKLRRLPCLVMTAVGAGVGLLSLLPQTPRMLWNFTESVPLGLYDIAQSVPAKGDFVALAPIGEVEATLVAYHILPKGRLLLKELAAVAGDTVCRVDKVVTVDGATVATAKERARDGRPLPAWSGCHVLRIGEVFVLARHPNSFDSRYLGPVGSSQIVGVARPLITLPPMQGAM